ncbi:FliM/FliN family flagellar motor switch protein [Rubrivirga sp.]|uniref:FliM/FliN family flagellar motor switch protein n=1 Tax=Rubrivirga sp. TaxID=1885344 RepID=UPI003B521456
MPTPHLDPLIRAPRGSEPDARPYDFARPRSFSDRQVRAVEVAHGTLAAGLAAGLGDALGEPVGARCTAVTEVLAVDLAESRARPTAFVTAALGPGGPRLGLDLPPALALFLVERQLGGSDPLGAEGRALSGLERAVVLRDWLPRVGVAFAEAWGTAPPTPLHLDDGADGLAPPDATVVVADVAVEVGGETATVSFAYPAATLRTLLAVSGRPAAPADAAPERAGDLLVDLRAELGRVRLPIGDLLRLAQDDVIPLDRPADAPVAVWVGDQLRCDARAGTRGARLALQLLTPPEPPSAP